FEGVSETEHTGPHRASAWRDGRVRSEAKGRSRIARPDPSPSGLRRARSLLDSATLLLGRGLRRPQRFDGDLRAMQPALLGIGLLPPPAAGAGALAGGDGARAGRAADRREAAIVEGVVRHVVLADVAPDLFLGPIDERVDLEQAEHRIGFDLG